MDPPSHSASPHLVLALALHPAAPAPVHVQGHLWNSERGGRHGQERSSWCPFGLLLRTVIPHQPLLIPPELLQSDSNKAGEENPTQLPCHGFPSLISSCLLSFWFPPAGTSPLHGQIYLFIQFFYIFMANFVFIIFFYVLMADFMISPISY